MLGSKFIQILFKRKQWEQIKHVLMVANPTDEENQEDKCAKFRPFHNKVNEIV